MTAGRTTSGPGAASRTTGSGGRRHLAHIALATIVTGTLLYAALHHDPTAKPPKGPVVPTVSVSPVAVLDPAPKVDTAAVTWADYRGLVGLPVSSTDGPHDLSGGLARGFARTPLGALLAAVNIAVRTNAVWGPQVFEATIKHQVVGDDGDAMLSGMREVYETGRREAGVADGEPLGGPVARVEAYRWQGYTPVEATVDMVTARRGDDDLIYRMATRVQVRWDGDDWRVLAPPGGAWGSAAAPLDSTGGYTVFTGRR